MTLIIFLICKQSSCQVLSSRALPFDDFKIFISVFNSLECQRLQSDLNAIQR
jgi:hypothetical protein